jgi:hypothetical protein
VLALAGVSPAGFLVAVAIDAGLSLLVFRHADRHGSRHATAWGTFTFLFAGLAIPVGRGDEHLASGRSRRRPGQREIWSLMSALVEFVESRWQLPEEGTWKVRGPRRDLGQLLRDRLGRG